jgi:hypothetical protein
MRRSVFAACLALAATLLAAPAQTQTARAWVSGHGTDQAGCGPVSAPCRTPQYAHDNIVTGGGEIDILDPAGYGSITINKAISIINDGVGTAGFLAPSGGNAITINAVSGEVQLRGLTVQGATTGGSSGIVFNTGAGLTVTNCVVQNFAYDGGSTGNGILLEPSSDLSFVITTTLISHNGSVGLWYVPSGSPNVYGVIDRVVATDNLNGILLYSNNVSGGSSTVAISNSTASNNPEVGIYTVKTTTLSIDNSTMSGNGDGIVADFSSRVLLSRSVITGNTTGILNQTDANTVYTYGNNLIDLNGTNINSQLNTSVTLR